MESDILIMKRRILWLSSCNLTFIKSTFFLIPTSYFHTACLSPLFIVLLVVSVLFLAILLVDKTPASIRSSSIQYYQKSTIMFVLNWLDFTSSWELTAKAWYYRNLFADLVNLLDVFIFFYKFSAKYNLIFIIYQSHT